MPTATSRKTPILAALCALGIFQVFMASCATTGPGSGDGISAEDRRVARERFDNYCSDCHGLDGKGQGPASTALILQPPDFTDILWHVVPDEELYVAISEGTEAVGLGPVMPPSPFADRPGVINALVEIVRSFGN